MDFDQPSILMDILSQRAIASLVMLCGMAVGLVNLRKHPGPSWMVLVATTFLLIPTIASAYSYAVLMSHFDGMSADNYRLCRNAIHVATLFFRTTGMALLIAAVYFKRPYRRPRPAPTSTAEFGDSINESAESPNP